MRANRARISFSFADQLYPASNLVHMLRIENASVIGLPIITSAEDTLQLRSGVFLRCSMARNSSSLSSEPMICSGGPPSQQEVEGFGSCECRAPIT